VRHEHAVEVMSMTVDVALAGERRQAAVGVARLGG
jgi:hypothetical protein